MPDEIADAYVLRLVSPAGKSARANEATEAELASNARQRRPVVYGNYLEWSDPDANSGMGTERWTDDVAKAKRFVDFMAALECWKAQSKTRPFRPDGRLNRPLTAYTVTIERLAPHD
jgi:hypothetical protein